MKYILKIDVDKKSIIPRVFNSKEKRNDYILKVLLEENIITSKENIPLDEDAFDISFVLDKKNIHVQSIIEKPHSFKIELVEENFD